MSLALYSSHICTEFTIFVFVHFGLLVPMRWSVFQSHKLDLGVPYSTQITAYVHIRNMSTSSILLDHRLVALYLICLLCFVYLIVPICFSIIIIITSPLFVFYTKQHISSHFFLHYYYHCCWDVVVFRAIGIFTSYRRMFNYSFAFTVWVVRQQHQTANMNKNR